MHSRKIAVFLLTLFAIRAHVCRADVLVGSGATWRYRKGTAEVTPVDRTAWRTNGLSDSGWPAGQAPFGYANTTDTEYPWLNHVLTDMRNGYSSFFLRHEFNVPDPGSITGLRLEVCYDDAYILWINGDRIADRNEPASAVYYALASSYHYQIPLLMRTGRQRVAVGVHDDIGANDSFVSANVAVGQV